MLKILLIFIFIGVNLCLVVATSIFQIQNRRSANDLPVQEDLDKFLNPIENLTHLLTNNITDIDIFFAYGVFLTNVHLQRVLLDKGQNIPDQSRSRIKAIVDTNEQNLNYFRKAARNDYEFLERDLVLISDLFVNSTYWMLRLKKMKYEVEPTHSYSDLENIYSKWPIYEENVNKVFDWIPSPKNSVLARHLLKFRVSNDVILCTDGAAALLFSDVCLVTVSLNPSFKGNSTSWCPVANTCYNMLTEGTNFGYALCHRLNILVMAQLGRGCFLLLGQEDEELKQKFCTMAYAEAEYIAMNDYGIADLMLEIMCFCATDGRVQFLRRTWLHKIFDFQNKNGCFGVDNPVLTNNTRRLDGCNSHTTSLASATYAAAVRFILEEYY